MRRPFLGTLVRACNSRERKAAAIEAPRQFLDHPAPNPCRYYGRGLRQDRMREHETCGVADRTKLRFGKVTRHVKPFAFQRLVGITPDHSRKAGARCSDRLVAAVGTGMLIRSF